MITRVEAFNGTIDELEFFCGQYMSAWSVRQVVVTRYRPIIYFDNNVSHEACEYVVVFEREE